MKSSKLFVLEKSEMKTNQLFEHEMSVVSTAEKVSAEIGAAIKYDDFKLILAEYKKLLKTTSRLVRHSDRMETNLNISAKEAREKSEQLEALSNQLAKYLSPQVYDSIFSGTREVALTSSRKKLTIFFSDIVEFTKLSENIESEELTGLLNCYLTEMSHVALKHGATIDKYIGDAIVIFFGDPKSKGIKEDALSCVKMAIEMKSKMFELRNHWKTFGLEEPLQSRMGIHTGFCTVGNFGSENRMDYTVIGSGVNLASRLESASEPDKILMSYDTYNYVKDTIPCVENKPIVAKGFSEPIRTFSVIDELENKKIISITIGDNRLDASMENLTKDQLEKLKLELSSALESIEIHTK
jgi:adenylate cyclase